jgi:hypothetical protein
MLGQRRLARADETGRRGSPPSGGGDRESSLIVLRIVLGGGAGPGNDGETVHRMIHDQALIPASRMIVSLKSSPRRLSAISWFKVRLSNHKKTPVADRWIGCTAVLGGNEVRIASKAWSVMTMRTIFWLAASGCPRCAQAPWRLI